MPALATFANHCVASGPAHEWYVARPRSIARVVVPRATSSAPSSECGMPKVRTKSPPVPRWTTASSTSSTPAMPFTTSLTVPSPPTATIRRAPPIAASRASSARCSGRSDRNASPVSPRSAARRAISGQRFPVAPPSEAGLTRKAVLLMVACDGRERDAGHAVDGGLEVLVGDARELAADDDVAHRQQTPGLHLAQRPEREDDGRLHLDCEHASRRPALMSALVRVVERVRGGDRAHAHRLAELLRRVDGPMDELPVGGRAVRVAADVVPCGAVGRDSGERHDEVSEHQVLLKAAARADAEETLDAELNELLHHDRRGRTAHPGRLHRDRMPLVLPGEAEQASLRVSLHGIVEVRLGDVLRPDRVSG